MFAPLRRATALLAALLATVAFGTAGAQPPPAGPSPTTNPSTPAPAAPAPAPAATPNPASPAPTAEQDAAIASIVSLRKAGRFGEAFAAARALSTAAPGLARGWHELGTLYALHGQLEDAATAYGRAVALDQNLHAARFSLAEVQRADGRHRAAVEHYRALLAAPGLGVAARRGEAICLLALGDRDAARVSLTALRDLDPSDEAGQWAQERLAAMERESAGGADVAELDAQAEAHFRAGRYRAAADAADFACREAPSAGRCYRLAVCQLALRDYLAAVGALRAALRVDPGHLPSLSAWPTALRKLRGEGSGGVRVSLAQPAPSEAIRLAADALLTGDLLLAERIAGRALAGGAASAVLHVVRAESRLRRGDTRRARVDFQAALRRRPKLQLARDGLLACDLADGRLANVRTALRLPSPPRPPEGVVLPAGYDANADLAAWERWRRNGLDHRLRSLDDAGLRPYPPFVPPASIDVESLRPATPDA